MTGSLFNIKKICESANVDEVNKLLDESWILLEIYFNNNRVVYVLGKTTV